MKPTLELPEDLLRQIKVRAAEEGRTMTDLLTELLRRALGPAKPKKKKRILDLKDLPIRKGGKPATPGKEMTPERVAEILWGSSR